MFLPCVSRPFFSEHLEAFRGAVLSIWFLPSVQPSCWVASKLSPSCCGRAPSGWVARVGGKIHSICVLCRVVLEGQNILSTCVYIYICINIYLNLLGRMFSSEDVVILKVNWWLLKWSSDLSTGLESLGFTSGRAHAGCTGVNRELPSTWRDTNDGFFHCPSY